MLNEDRPKSVRPERMPLQVEFHYEVDERGDHYRVWEEHFNEPVGIGGDLEQLSRHVGAA